MLVCSTPPSLTGITTSSNTSDLGHYPVNAFILLLQVVTVLTTTSESSDFRGNLAEAKPTTLVRNNPIVATGFLLLQVVVSTPHRPGEVYQYKY